MIKAPIKKDRLKSTIIVSLILHAVLFVLLIVGSLHENKDTQSGGSGTDIDAVMVDPSAIVQQYQRQQSQKQAAELAKQQQAERDEQQAKLLQQQRQQEQQRLKALEQQRLQAKQQAEQQAAELLKQQQQAEQAIKQAQEQQRQAEIAAKQAEQQAQQAAQQAKEQAEKLAQQQAAAEQAKQQAALAAKRQAQQQAAAAAKAEQAKQQALAAKKQSEEVADLLGSLSSSKNAPATGNAKPKGVGKQSTSGASSEQIDSYAGQIRSAIQSKFYDWQLYRGKECTLRIRLAPDGLLLAINAESGDKALCQAAIAAAKQAQLPKPPNADIYQLFKNAPLDFRPQ